MDNNLSFEILQYERTALKSAVFFASLKYVENLEELIKTGKINNRPVNKKTLDTMSVFLNIIKKILGDSEDIGKMEIKKAAFKVGSILQEDGNKEIGLQIKMISLQIENICLRHENRKLQSDHLTGLYNRRFIESSLNQAIEDKKNNGTNYGVILIDIDHFKSINDTFGHSIGDSVLEELGNIFREQFRGEDKIGRWGGEEFIIIMKGGNDDDYKKKMLHIKNIIERELAKRIREIENSGHNCTYNFNCNKCQEVNCGKIMANKTITVSIGVTSLSGNDSVKDVIDRADEGLYKAKKTGRNKIIFINNNLKNDFNTSK